MSVKLEDPAFGETDVEDSLALQVVRAFVAKINAHQVDALAERMTEQHVLVDAAGVAHRGPNAALGAWRELFASVPDYRIRAERMLSEGETVAIFGVAGGTCIAAGQLDPRNRWDAPTAWKVLVRGTRVAEWHTYADTRAMREIMERITRESGSKT